MSSLTRSALWLVLGFLACATVALSMAKLVGYLYLISGRGVKIPFFLSSGSLVLVAMMCFLISWACSVKGGCKTSLTSLAIITTIALGFGIGSVLAGKPPYQNFLDGFTSRVTANINENEATNWADQIFASDKPDRAEFSFVELPQNKVPAFFLSVFSGAKPSAVISYSPTGKPMCVHVYVGGRDERWGVAIFNTNSTPNNDVMAYRQCGKRLFAFHSSH